MITWHCWTVWVGKDDDGKPLRFTRRHRREAVTRTAALQAERAHSTRREREGMRAEGWRINSVGASRKVPS